MLVIPYFDPDSSTFSYLVGSGEEAVIIDPVMAFDPVSGRTGLELVRRQLAEAKARGWGIRFVLETHAHADHLSAAQHIKDSTGAAVVIGAGITDVQRRAASVYNLPPDFATDGRQFDRLVNDGDMLDFGGTGIEVMATPGHTGDSVTYRMGDAAFVGDSLFMPRFGTGRCDFPGADAGQLFDSIDRIHRLPAFTRLYLCHDYPPDDQPPCCETTVAESRSNNVHIKAETSREAFVSMREARDATLPLPRLIVPAIQVNIRAGGLPDPESNGVSYLRIPVDAELT